MTSPNFLLARDKLPGWEAVGPELNKQAECKKNERGVRLTPS